MQIFNQVVRLPKLHYIRRDYTFGGDDNTKVDGSFKVQGLVYESLILLQRMIRHHIFLSDTDQCKFF